MSTQQRYFDAAVNEKTSMTQNTVTVVSYDESTDQFVIETTSVVREKIDADQFPALYELLDKPGIVMTDKERALALIFRDNFHEEPTDMISASRDF